MPEDYSVTLYRTSLYPTIRLVPGQDAPELWDVAAVADYLGVKPSTVTAYLARRQMPEPDYRLGGAPVWLAETIVKWHRNRPSQQEHPKT
jgi:hypothetical protein